MPTKYSGSEGTITVDGVKIGKIQSISADAMYGLEPAMEVPPRMSGELTMTGASFDMAGLAAMFGAPPVQPKWDVEVTSWKRTGKLPNGRTTLPKSKRIQKKWKKRYYTKQVVTYRGCEIVDVSEVKPPSL